MSKLVKCKACGAEISGSAKSCPQCGHKKKGGIGAVFLWLAAGLVGLSILGAVVGDSESGSSHVSGSQGSSIASYAIGDTVETGNFDFAVKSVRNRSSVGSMYIEELAAEGAIYVVVTFTYTNTSDRPIGAYSVPTVLLEDAKGTKYKRDIGATSSYVTESNLNAKGFSDVNPGIQINDAAVFEVSETLLKAGGWHVYVDNGRNDFRVVIK